jgi:amino acid adenylation domain-containing protein
MRLDSFLAANAARSPRAIAAVELGGDAVSYGVLDGSADAVSQALRSVGVGAGDRVGLCVPKCIGAVASIFGVLRVGAAYVPVDVSAPTPRNAFIFNDCAVRVVIAADSCAPGLQAELGTPGWVRHTLPVPTPHGHGFTMLVRADSSMAAPANDSDLAYILYTSGSTGRPKGVMHSHATALSFIDWCSQEFAPQPEDRFSSHAPFHFDLSIFDIYVPIKHGAAVVLIGSEAGKQPGTLSKAIGEHRITIWYSTPSILRMLMEHGKLDDADCSSLRLVLFAGEVFPIKHLSALMERWPAPMYYNLYGPTETNVCTYFKLAQKIAGDQEASLPIGRSCSGDRTLVVSSDGSRVAPGSEGELLVTGGSVMLGYWNLPAQNDQAFCSLAGERWYRTGDIVQENAVGDYIFLGRRDRMVKRRGYRVELGEIEAALHRHPAIPEAAVTAHIDAEGDVLIRAFVAWEGEMPASLVKLKQFCGQNLPLYMVPDQFTVLTALPKTSTDKIDYQYLKGLA